MQRSDFSFDLPESLIAQYPLPDRSASRLLCLARQSGEHQDRMFLDLPDLIGEGDLLVLNDTRVIRARVFGEKASGGKLEVLVERILDDHRCLAHVRASKSPRPGSSITLEQNASAKVLGRSDDLFELSFEDERPLMDVLETIGHMPLPPYIHRRDEVTDQQRYQTVYARHPGAVAAPTAGLHFSNDILDRLKARGVRIAMITLHVGAGTFQPVRVDQLDQHKMHSEFIEITSEVCDQINTTHNAGCRVIAVGTTVVRALETAARSGRLAPFSGDTDIFITPGFRFNCVDAMLTNFHLPESTLLMLVSAFAGHASVMTAYQHAIKSQYRFFSYGDAMFIA